MSKKLLITGILLLNFAAFTFGQTQVGSDLLGESTQVTTPGVYGAFGTSTAINATGTRIAVSEPGLNDGKVKVYDWVNNSWTLTHTFLASDYGDGKGFGSDIELSDDGSRLAIGNKDAEDNGSFLVGAAYVFEETGSGWSQVGQTQRGTAANQQFGHYIGISGDGSRILVSGNGNSSTVGGVVRAYEDIAGTWTQMGTDFTNVDPADALGIGAAISGDGTTIAVSAAGADTDGFTNNGNIKVYRWTPGTPGTWTLIGDFYGNADNLLIGRWLDLSNDGNRLAFSKIGATDVDTYEYAGLGTAWNPVSINAASIPSPNAVAVKFSASGRHIALSAFSDTSQRLMIYEEINGNWSQVGSTITGGSGGNHWIDITHDGATIVYGARNFNTSQGKVSVYDFPTSVLPVSYLTFTGRASDNGHHLYWATGTEDNNEGFQVERSGDGRLFEPIGWVAGAGTTLSRQDYTYLDAAPLAGTAYYRLKQVDYDGTAAYSDIITLHHAKGSNGDAVLFPNPVTDQLTIEQATASILTLTNALGQPVYQCEITHSPYTLDVNHLPKGIYTATLQYPDGRLQSTTLVK